MKINLKNSHREREKTNEMEIFELNLTRRLENKYAPRSYAERWAAARTAALICSYLFNAYSFATGAAALVLFTIMNISNIITIAIVSAIGVAIAIVLEVLKRKASGETFTQGYSSGNWSISGLAGMVFLTIISIVLSFSASYLMPAVVTAPPTPPIADLSQEQTYQEAIAHKKQEAIAIKKQREWKGKVGDKDQAEINKLNDQVTQLEKDLIAHRGTTRAELDKKHQANLANYYSNVGRNQWILGVVTIITELLFLVCFMYMEHYDWKSVKERIELDAANTSNSNSTPTPSPSAGGYTVGPTPTSGGGGPGPTHTLVDRVIVKGYVYEAPDKEFTYPKDNEIHVPYRTETVVPDSIDNTEVNPHAKDNGIHVPYEDSTETVVEDDLDTYTVEHTEIHNNVVELVLQKNEKPCAHCGTVMEYKSTLKKFCSDACKWAAFEARKANKT